MTQKHSPGNTVVNSYIATESMLVDVLRAVPYCIEHENIWSPVLVTILQETCSQLDSLWFYEAKNPGTFVESDILTIAHYFEYFGAYVKYKWVVFWGEEPKVIQPFKPWSTLEDSEFKRQNFKELLRLDWWEVYQKVKHDRLTHKREATLGRAVNALGALFLAILRCEHCRDAIVQTGWLSSASWDSNMPQDGWLEEVDNPKDKLKFFQAESRLFSYPFGWCRVPIEKDCKWRGNASYRFRLWFDEYES